MIVCIERKMSTNGFALEHIVELKWRDTAKNTNGQTTVEKLIEWIDQGNQLYCTNQNYGQPPVIVLVERPLGRKPYLRTKPNNTTDDNLLSLPTYV